MRQYARPLMIARASAPAVMRRLTVIAREPLTAPPAPNRKPTWVAARRRRAMSDAKDCRSTWPLTWSLTDSRTQRALSGPVSSRSQRPGQVGQRGALTDPDTLRAA